MHAPFAESDLVQLTDPKGRLRTITLKAGEVFHTHRGGIPHDSIIGLPSGSVVSDPTGTGFLCLRPLLDDYVLGMPRGAAVIYPKDAVRILGLAGIAPGDRVAEAGVGSGALTCYLLQAVTAQGEVTSLERREDFARIAERNVSTWFRARPENWTLRVGDMATDLVERDLDAIVLDMLAPWDCLPSVADALAPGGSLVGYVATTTQLSRLVETLREDGRWTEPRAEETMVRTWHLEGLSVRPDHRMIAHTGFLVVCRRLAPDTRLPVRRRRPAPGAYGEDYDGPGSGSR